MNNEEKILNLLEQNNQKFEKVFDTLEQNNQKFEKVFDILEQNNQKFEKVFDILEQHDKRLDALEQQCKKLDVLDEHSKRLDVLEQQHKECMARFDKIEQKLCEHDEDIKDIKRILLNIEIQVTEKIPALFDAYSANQDKHKVYDEQISSLEVQAFNHDIRISALEDRCKLIST